MGGVAFVSQQKKRDARREEFLTHVWIPTLRESRHAGVTARLPSHPYREGVEAADRDPAFRTFWRQAGPVDSGRDTVLDLSSL